MDTIKAVAGLMIREIVSDWVEENAMHIIHNIFLITILMS